MPQNLDSKSQWKSLLENNMLLTSGSHLIITKYTAHLTHAQLQ